MSRSARCCIALREEYDLSKPMEGVLRAWSERLCGTKRGRIQEEVHCLGVKGFQGRYASIKVRIFPEGYGKSLLF
jgi:hypothetical protein